MRDVFAADDPAAMLTKWTRAMVEIDARVATLFSVLDVAADVDLEARNLRDEFAHQRLLGARAVVKRLAEVGVLTAAMSRADAVDVAWFATDPVLFDRFVRIRGWSVNRFQAWLAALLVAQLLD